MSGARMIRGRAVPGAARVFQRIYTRLGCAGRPPHFVVEFHPYADLTHTIRLREDTAQVRLSDVLRHAPPSVVEAAAAILLARLYRRRPPDELLDLYRKFSHSRSTRRRLLEVRRRRVRRMEHRPAGAYHNLEPMFDRLNRRYFEDSLTRPRLGWSARTWRTQLGCFDPALNQIVMNRQLDHGNVPEYVVAYVLYHEMLHLKHPMRFARCRRESHSPQFRREERRFTDYTRAVRFLATFPTVARR
ncbi:MAG TPA: SprT-like domain-containing protein [Candidatus Acidoferrales bacterium]|nr:SprT-like domain-containing protein [Candidatus Acidoferrales bacterium]